MKDYSVRIRMTQIEKEMILAKAKELNMSMSEYIRFISINGKIIK
jgi:hypothetical protein